MLLAIDTATHTSSIALADASGVIAELTWRTRENHTQSLMPQLVHLLELVKASTKEIRAIAVSNGPGSFTGLRIGLSMAKGLAFSTHAVLIGVPTLDICASAAANCEQPICAVLQAGRGRYAAAVYNYENDALRRTSEYVFGTAKTLTEQLNQLLDAMRVCMIGEVEEPLRAALNESKSFSIAWSNTGSNVRRAGALAAIGWRRWQAGEVDNLATLAPYYIPTASLA